MAAPRCVAVPSRDHYVLANAHVPTGCIEGGASSIAGGGASLCVDVDNLAAVDMDGKLRWKTNLLERYGQLTLYWDYGSSPALTEQDVVMAVLHHGESYLAAFDKLTGNLHWKVARNYETSLEGDHSYATPLVIRQQGREALLVLGGERLTAHDAADGRTLWTCGDFNPDAKKNWVPVASPVVVGDMAVVPYGRGDRLHGIKLGGSGDVTATHRLWRRDDSGAFVPTPAEYKGRVYVLRDKGEVDRRAAENEGQILRLAAGGRRETLRRARRRRGVRRAHRWKV